MTDTTPKQFQIYLPGLLRVLAESLYSNERVAIRELIQNAHDSTVRRRVESDDQRYTPRIDITIDRSQPVITIRDNGTGLTPDEVETYLSTIGRSYTRQLGENLNIFSPERADELIGQFGMGFLSAFLIAAEVTLTTRSYQPDSPTIQWHSTGDVHYSTEIVDERPVGTEVKLTLKPSATHLLELEVMRSVIRQYADFLSIPIYLNRGYEPINAMQPPWDTPDQIEEFITGRMGEAYPLAIIPLRDHMIDVGHDQLEIPLRGFLYVPAVSVVSVAEYGDLAVFIRRMFICAEKSDLLPVWARFVRGMVESPRLQPTASREQVQRDEGFSLVQQAIREQLIEGLRTIARETPFVWRQIVRGHRNLIIGWAVRDDEFFEQVAPIVTFRTSRGLLTLPEYLDITGGSIYYTSKPTASLQDRILSEGGGQPVIDASNFVESVLINKYADRRDGVRAFALDDAASMDNPLITPADELDATYALLLAHLREQGINARIVRFAPPDIPAVMTFPQNAEFIHDARDLIDSGDIPAPFISAVEEHLTRYGEDATVGTLCLNANNPLVQALSRSTDTALRAAALLHIHALARLLNGRMLTGDTVRELMRTSSEALARIVEERLR